jgi:hypothetical protein
MTEQQSLTEVQRAFKEWQEHFPAKHFIAAREIEVANKHNEKRTIVERAHWDGDCCSSSHFTTDENGNNKPKPDDKVCARERAWRRYVALRDEAPLVH